MHENISGSIEKIDFAIAMDVARPFYSHRVEFLDEARLSCWRKSFEPAKSHLETVSSFETGFCLDMLLSKPERGRGPKSENT